MDSYSSCIGYSENARFAYLRMCIHLSVCNSSASPQFLLSSPVGMLKSRGKTFHRWMAVAWSRMFLFTWSMTDWIIKTRLSGGLSAISEMADTLTFLLRSHISAFVDTISKGISVSSSVAAFQSQK